MRTIRRSLALVTSIGLVLAAATPVLADHESGHDSYVILESTGGAIIPGTTEIDLEGTDDSVIQIALPFDVYFYDTLYEEGDPLIVSSNGNIQFEPDPVLGGNSDYIDEDDCLPEEESPGSPQYNAAVFALFADLNDADEDGGVFTAVYGDAPNRYFVIEWRTQWYESEEDVNFEIILYENSSMVTVIYGEMGAPDPDADTYLIGVQEDETAAWTQYACFAEEDTGDLAWPLAPGTVHDYVLGIVDFSSATYSVDEDAGTATITVNRTGTTRGEVTVGYTTTSGTATAGTDYTETSGTLTFADGEETATFEVPIIDDDDAEADETVLLSLESPGGGAVLGSQSTATLTIVDDDDAGTASPSPSGSAAPTATARPSGRGLPNTSSPSQPEQPILILTSAVLLASLVTLGGLSVKHGRAAR